MATDRELALALEHPRGTERRTLLAYRDALNDAAAYARLPERDRDVIVRWAAVRGLLKERHGLDHDEANLADPLLPHAALRAHVLAGERVAARVPPAADPGGDIVAVVAAIRAARR